MDLISRSLIPLDRLHYLIFDEVDRMLSESYGDPEQVGIGYIYLYSARQEKSSSGSMESQLRTFLSQCSLCPRQTGLFSATIPPRYIFHELVVLILSSVERLARSALINEISIEVGRSWGSLEASKKTADSRGLSMIPANITQHVLFVHTYQKKVLVNLTNLLIILRLSYSRCCAPSHSRPY